MGSETQALQQVQLGTTQMTVTTTGPIESFVPEIRALEMPFLFPSYEAADKVLDGSIGQDLSKKFEKSGFVALAFLDNGWSEEVSRHLLVAITFLGGTVAYKHASFIGLVGIGQYLGPVVQRVIVIALQLPTLGCFGLIAWFGVGYTIKAAEHTSSSLQIPMSIPYTVIPIAAAIFVVHVLADLQRTLSRQA